VYLDVEVGVAERGRYGQHRRDRRGVAELVTAVEPGPAGVPRGGRRHLGRDQHVRAVVLDRLEHRDRAAELLADLGVLGRHLGGLGGDAGRLGREHGPGHIGQQPARTRQHRRRRRVQADLGGAPALVHVGRDIGLVASGRLLDHQHVVAGRDEQHVRQVAAEHHAGLPGRGAVGKGDLAAQRGRADHAALGQPGQQLFPQVIRCCGGQDGAGDHGRDERSGGQVPAHLLGHDQGLRQSEARAAEVFRYVQPEHAEAGQLGPEAGQFLGLGREQGAGGRAGLMLGEQAGDGLRQGAVLFRDGDRHG
jgi:hypothetical protein